MDRLEKEICQVTKNIWTGMFGISVEKSAGKVESYFSDSSLSACVYIVGGWEGAVTVQCSVELIRRVATIMFSVGLEQITDEHTFDAMAELTNMTGGNLKALMPEPCVLSLPILVEKTNGRLRVSGSRQLHQVGFQHEGKGLLVTVLERHGNRSKTPKM